ncbi:MAG: DUF5379 domain-containing protein [archaeon]|nr:DUF5379 domain-containing protein [archaeon]
MDATIKIVILHLVTAIVAAVLSASFSLGWFGFKNEVLALAIGLIILYITGQIAQKLFEDEISGFSDWLWNGIVPFYFMHFILWTVLVNYL